ncbi:helix-turn-helix domain-containing protein [Streptomyces olivoreticuli]
MTTQDPGRLLRKLRLERGLSQIQLAERAGVSQAVVSRVEVGHHSPTIRSLSRLADALDADLILDFNPRSFFHL